LIALFGGSFNPVHNGHLIVGRDVLEDFNFKEVWFVPARVQPLKGELTLPASVRLEALKEAVALEPRFKVWDYELREEGLSYTYRTLEAFWQLYGEKPAFVMGADSFNSFHLWKNPRRILSLARLVVVSRPGYPLAVEKVEEALGLRLKFVRVRRGRVSLPGEWQVALYEGRLLEISATEIRERLFSGRSISYFLPERVEKIVRRWRDGLRQNVQQNDP
jgi:nicotinate-nucleotide adenylyltransferase